MNKVLADASERGMGEVWWLNPFKLCLFFIIPLYTLIFLVPEIFGTDAINLKFRTYFTWQYYVLGLAFLLVLANGALIGGMVGRRAVGLQPPDSINRHYLDVLAVLTVLAYLVWYRNLFADPSTLFALLKGHRGATQGIRESNRTIGGVTTLTQLGGAYIVLYLNQIWGNGRPFESKRYRTYFYGIIGLAAFRMYAWSERLAVIELVVPVAVMYVAHRAPRTTLSRLGLPALPFLGLLGLLAVFGATEYFRTWAPFYQYQNASFWGFITRRLASYYYTALNNGAGMLTIYEWPTWHMETLLDWLYKFPILGVVVRYVTDIQPEGSFLERYADPEYNNLSGIFMVIRDTGLAGGLVFAAVFGGVTGYFWRALLLRRSAGVFYPICFLTLLEIFRIFYVTGGRAFPTVAALVLGYALIRDKDVTRGNKGHTSSKTSAVHWRRQGEKGPFG